MARMATLLVCVSGSTFNLYRQAVEMSEAGKFPRKELNKALCELIATARKRKKAEVFDHLPACPKWSDLNYYLVEGWLYYQEVNAVLNHLLMFGRYLPIPEGAKGKWSRPRNSEYTEV